MGIECDLLQSESRQPVDLDTGLLKRDRMLVQRTPMAELCIGFGSRGELLKRLAAAEALLKDFNPDQAHDDQGRWSREGGGPGGDSAASGRGQTQASATALVPVAATTVLAPALATGLRALFGEITTVVADALATLVAGAAAPVTFLGVLLIPMDRSSVSSGTLPDHPDIKYEYNGDEGYFVLSQNGAPIFGGLTGGDGVVRDPDGNPVGRRVDGGIVMDPAALSQIIGDRADGEARVNAQVQARADTDDPQLCPDPVPDRPGRRSDAALDYEDFIHHVVNPDNPVPLGLAVTLWNPTTNKYIYFDDCYQDSGVMVEAKGSYQQLYETGYQVVADGADRKLLKQARNQVQAAGDRPIIWYFREPWMADHAAALFKSVPELEKIEIVGRSLTKRCVPVGERQERGFLPVLCLNPQAQIWWEIRS